jgi:hypothetical protein
MMRNRLTTPGWSLRANCLEARLAPSATVEIVSRADPSLISESAGGNNYIGPQQPAHTQPTSWQFPLPPVSRTLSLDGRFVVFASTATNVVAGQVDTNVGHDIFVHDRQTGATELISHVPGQPLVASDSDSFNPTISGDGRFVAYASRAHNLISGFVDGADGPNEFRNVYVYDRLTGTTLLASRAAGSATKCANLTSDSPVISDDGAKLAFVSRATNIVIISNGMANFRTYVFDRTAGTVALAAHAYFSSTFATPGHSFVGGISGDGRYVAYQCVSEAQVSGYAATYENNIFLYDTVTGENTPVSRSAVMSSAYANNQSYAPMISRDGRYVAFSSYATDLIAGFIDGNGPAGEDIYVFDRLTGFNQLVSRSVLSATRGGNGTTGSELMTAHAISDGGEVVVYASAAGDLVAGFSDNNGESKDVFLFDRLSGTNVLASRSAAGGADGSDGWNMHPAVTGDGRLVLFDSRANNLVAGFIDRNGPGTSKYDSTGQDVFAFDRATGSVALISGSNGSATVGGNSYSYRPAASSVGGVVAFATNANDLVSSTLDRNGGEDVVLRDLSTGVSTVASKRHGAPSQSAGGSSLHDGYRSQASDDGRYVVLLSTAQNLVAGQVDENFGTDVFVTDRVTRTTVLASRSVLSPTRAGNALSGHPVISRDGRFVAFNSLATDLVPNFVDANGPDRADLYLFDRVLGSVTLVSHQAGAPSTGGNIGTAISSFGGFYEPVINGDGRVIVYSSFAQDLIADFVDTNGPLAPDLYAYDRLTGVNTLINRSWTDPNVGSKGSAESRYASVSADGRYVAFPCFGDDLVAGQIGGGGVYLFDRQTNAVSLVSHSAGSKLTQLPGDTPVVSADGRYITFHSSATQLVPGQIAGGSVNIFIYDRVADTSALVTHIASSPVTGGGATTNWPNSISADGRYVAYLSAPGALVDGFVDGPEIYTEIGGGGYDCFVYDRVTGVNTLVSRSTAGHNIGANGTSVQPAISGDGRFIAFLSYAQDLVPGFVNGNFGYYNPGCDIYVFDRLTGQVQLASRSLVSPVHGGDGQSFRPVVNHDGSAVIFFGDADDLVAGDANGSTDVFAYVTPPPQILSVKVADGSPQRSVVRSLTVTFDQPVFFAGSPAAAFELSRNGTVVSGQWSVVSQPNPSTVTISFTGSVQQFGSLIDGRYVLRVRADQVSNIGPLDGNNDGVGGDDFTFGFHRLFGDADGNGSVDALDFRAFRLAFGTNSFVFDFDGDGDTDAADFAAFRGRFGLTVP